MSSRKTNIEALTEIMDFSDFGALAQVFIIDAITKQARRILTMPEDELRQQFEGYPIDWQAWRGVAAEVQTKLDAHLGS